MKTHQLTITVEAEFDQPRLGQVYHDLTMIGYTVTNIALLHWDDDMDELDSDYNCFEDAHGSKLDPSNFEATEGWTDDDDDNYCHPWNDSPEADHINKCSVCSGLIMHIWCPNNNRQMSIDEQSARHVYYANFISPRGSDDKAAASHRGSPPDPTPDLKSKYELKTPSGTPAQSLDCCGAEHCDDVHTKDQKESMNNEGGNIPNTAAQEKKAEKASSDTYDDAKQSFSDSVSEYERSAPNPQCGTGYRVPHITVTHKPFFPFGPDPNPEPDKKSEPYLYADKGPCEYCHRTEVSHLEDCCNHPNYYNSNRENI